MKSHYGGELDKVQYTSVDDLTKLVEQTMTVSHVKRTDTTWSRADVYLRPGDAATELPSA